MARLPSNRKMTRVIAWAGYRRGYWGVCRTAVPRGIEKLKEMPLKSQTERKGLNLLGNKSEQCTESFEKVEVYRGFRTVPEKGIMLAPWLGSCP